jgi:hypothetical protein
MNWRSFFIGTVVGLILGVSLFYIFACRYELNRSGPENILTIKLDRWTGKTWMWRFYKDQNGQELPYWEEFKTQMKPEDAFVNFGLNKGWTPDSINWDWVRKNHPDWDSSYIHKKLQAKPPGH